MEEINVNVELILKSFIDQLKKDCNTYGEVLKKLNKYEKEISYINSEQQEIKIVFIQYVRSLLNKEMNDLPLTNRPEK